MRVFVPTLSRVKIDDLFMNCTPRLKTYWALFMPNDEWPKGPGCLVFDRLPSFEGDGHRFIEKAGDFTFEG